MGKINTMLAKLDDSSSQQEKSVRSEDVKEVLEKYQMPYTKSTYTESMDITPCFTQPDSEEAGIIFDNLTFRLRVKEYVDENIFKQLMNIIKTCSRVQKREGGDKFYMDLYIDNFLISKPIQN